MKTRYNANIFLQIIHVAISTELAIIWKPKVFIHVKQNWMISHLHMKIFEALTRYDTPNFVFENHDDKNKILNVLCTTMVLKKIVFSQNQTSLFSQLSVRLWFRIYHDP